MKNNEKETNPKYIMTMNAETKEYLEKNICPQKSAVEIITNWIEKNIDIIYYPEVDLKTYKETGKMYFNKEFVLSHLGGVMPDVKEALNK